MDFKLSIISFKPWPNELNQYYQWEYTFKLNLYIYVKFEKRIKPVYYLQSICTNDNIIVGAVASIDIMLIIIFNACLT